MKRLTKRTCGVVVYVGTHENTTTGQIPCEVSAAGVREMMERLAAYEDTWLMPDEIKSMQEEHFSGLGMAKLYSTLMELEKYQEADKAGRLVVLPCKVGDTAYRLQYIEQTPGRFILGVAEIKFSLIWLEEFGKTVFLTREEAEAALEATKNE